MMLLEYKITLFYDFVWIFFFFFCNSTSSLKSCRGGDWWFLQDYCKCTFLLFKGTVFTFLKELKIVCKKLVTPGMKKICFTQPYAASLQASAPVWNVIALLSPAMWVWLSWQGLMLRSEDSHPTSLSFQLAILGRIVIDRGKNVQEFTEPHLCRIRKSCLFLPCKWRTFKLSLHAGICSQQHKCCSFNWYSFGGSSHLARELCCPAVPLQGKMSGWPHAPKKTGYKVMDRI